MPDPKKAPKSPKLSAATERLMEELITQAGNDLTPDDQEKFNAARAKLVKHLINLEQKAKGA